MAGPRLLSVDLIVKLVLFFSSAKVFCQGIERFLRLTLFNLDICAEYASCRALSNSVILFLMSMGAGGGFQFLFFT